MGRGGAGDGFGAALGAPEGERGAAADPPRRENKETRPEASSFPCSREQGAQRGHAVVTGVKLRQREQQKRRHERNVRIGA